MSQDPLEVIAASYKTIADTQQILAQAALRSEETHQRIDATQRLALRLQVFAIILLGLALLGGGVLGWEVLHNEQRIEAYPRVILEQVRPRYSVPTPGEGATP